MSVLPPGQKSIKKISRHNNNNVVVHVFFCGSLTWWQNNRHAYNPQQPRFHEGVVE